MSVKDLNQIDQDHRWSIGTITPLADQKPDM